MAGWPLLRYTARTLLAAWVIVSGLFLLSRLNTDRNTFLQHAVEGSGRLLSAAGQDRATRQLLQRYGLDIPLFYVTLDTAASAGHPGWHWNGSQNQYHHWFRRLLAGDLGTSYRDGLPVTEVLSRSLSYTLPLTIVATLTSIALALGIVLWLSYRPQWRSAWLTGLHFLQALPLFLLATGLLLLLANPDALAWFPTYGLGLEELDMEWWQQPAYLLYFLTLPALSLVLVTVPGLVVQLNGALQHELQQPYIATARAKGASSFRIIRHHALRNALLPTVALLSELLPNIVAGATVVEVLFALPGMGRLLADSAATQDYPVLLGALALVALVRVGAQVLADALYQIIDPRIRMHT